MEGDPVALALSMMSNDVRSLVVVAVHYIRRFSKSSSVNCLERAPEF